MKAMTRMEVWFKELPAREQEEKIREIGRRLFSTPEGAIFLTVMLDDMQYNMQAGSEREVALKNYATILLRDRIGLTRDSLAVTTALLNIGTKEHNDA